MKDFKNLIEICNEIDLIIEKKNNDQAYKNIGIFLNRKTYGKFSYSEIDLFCSKLLKISDIKNRILRNLEKKCWYFLSELANAICGFRGLSITENEVLDYNKNYHNKEKKILSRLIGLSKEIIELHKCTGKVSKFSLKGAITLIAELTGYFIIPNAKELFLDCAKSKFENIQYHALIGLEKYYYIIEDEIDDDVVELLNEIIIKTDNRSIVFICLQIQIDTGRIDEMAALCIMDDWKDEHYR